MKLSLLRLLLVSSLCLVAVCGRAAELRIDFAKPIGKFRTLHGVNGGPVNVGGTIDVTKHWQQAGIPITRLHDCEWPGGRVVDMHVLFPTLKADPNDANNYRFAESDDYLATVKKSGAQIVYRLGENIEHTPRKYYVHPPANYDAWAAACLGIIRHYNDGWADGFHHDIKYWEIWNEPENRPACWTGSDEDYYRLYSTAAKAIKAKYPKLKVGGPAVGATGEIVEGRWQPTEFLQGFLKHCTQEKAPLDFFSWHTYTNDPAVYKRKSLGMRAWLDAHGYKGTELHLNEWNYLPNNDWSGQSKESQGEVRAKWFAEQGGPSGAAFVAYTLLDLQDSPIDIANFFHGDSSTFGLFTQHGEPKKTFYAMQAFRELLAMPQRVAVEGNIDGEGIVAAGVDAQQACAVVMLSNYRHNATTFTLSLNHLPWTGATACEVRYLGASSSFTRSKSLTVSDSRLEISAPAPSVVIIRLKARPAR